MSQTLGKRARGVTFAAARSKYRMSAMHSAGGLIAGNPMEGSDQRLRNLWERAREGEKRAYHDFLSALAVKLRPYVRRQLLRLDRDGSEAEDIVQEVLLAVHCKRHAYDRSVPVMAWVHAIARYKMIDFVRSSARSSRAVPLADIENVVAADALQIDDSFSVRARLAALPEKMRRSIELIKVVGLSASEAAAVTGMSEAALRVNVHRGLKAMAKLIA